ncbi:MAG: DUF1569 domain-containing protein [Planctomycetia bacterium]|jgi:hypothetical protein|nr:DUF1569 domain-containing protein [Planctomycetia bacterium]MCC7313389.1 DUF1569 domain-containing protein [Planctomycetota bacterium]OQZ01691.1 MAG: hypothetical protein B6D36_13855 [Planctomycetes bacterium UTPLA1]
MINTKHVTDRRTLRFNSVEDVLADIDRIVAAEKAAKLRTTGNWTAGQAMGHVAEWINYAYKGYPIGPPPWLIRVILGFLKNRYLRKGLPAGVMIPKVKNGTFATDNLSIDDGATRLREALRRLSSGEPAKFKSPALGDLPDSERIALNLRHAELHLSFLHLQ